MERLTIRAALDHAYLETIVHLLEKKLSEISIKVWIHSWFKDSL